ncbi:ABC transporter substrate-binding protein [Frankia sp. CNm7]|uniref:ABC transporter substrate-binding protein n=1 Tax=Frankia nepalensis TaxID=1836974 RepID=A0A937RMS3_9ACTN|nr:ABC transporter substrate-binding protein [Frankia nepalensis]MBL7501140.1 ABC transporter substrate-binding protein [Frankia nepalensis]MBL7513746.1 ABC transporter substrate-binding protein [Frankia nepalensis]MBL7523111.1 ABC transporter substrate-binding protein [Frankia nepalensis]MBL7631654.1 ABC transporter substrate-binding protein [Frankia nepalensis]
MSRRPWRPRVGAAVAALVVVALGACSSSSPDEPSGPDLTTVRVGIGPFLDNQTLPLAQQLGFATEQGIKFEFKTLPSNDAIYQAVQTGQLDVGAGTIRGLVPLAQTAPTLRNYIIRDQFLGFFLVGRTEDDPPVYADLVDQGRAPEEAKTTVLRSWVGKTFNIVGSQNFAPIAAGLQAAGIDPESVKINNFADDAKAAAAFQSGEGDFYTGSLPIQSALLLDHPDDYVNVGGYEVLGPAGLAYDTWTTSQGWLDENPELALKVLAVVLKTSRYIDDNLDSAAPKLTDLVNTASAGSLPVDQVKLLATEFTDFLTPEDLTSKVFAPASPYYWQNEVKLDIEQSSPAPPADYDPAEVANAEEWFQKLRANSALMSWVNGPLN